MRAHVPLPVVAMEDLAPIPPIVHQVWMGSQPPPWVRHYWALWDDFAAAHDPVLTLRRWTDADLPRLLTGRLVEQMPHLSPVQRANFARVEVLAFHGGLYMDCDTTPLRPLTEWIGARASWAAAMPSWAQVRGKVDMSRMTCNTAMLGFSARHPFLAEVWELGVLAARRGTRLPPFTAGPRVFGRVVKARPEYGVQVPVGPFMGMGHSGRAHEAATGRPTTPQEWREFFPQAVVAHSGMITWQDNSHAEKRAAWRAEVFDGAAGA
jgi:hypothetical protein